MDFINRTIEAELRSHLSRKEITLLIGPRQVGKSTLLYRLQQHLIDKGEKTIFFNLDREEDWETFKSQLKVLSKIELFTGKQNCYVFIDEIQRKENAGLFLKGLYDRPLPYKYIVSGSGSLELKEKVVESLAGRKRLFEITPVTFKEFLDYKTQYQFSDRLSAYADLHIAKIQQLLEEYLVFGGYPAVVKGENIREKSLLIDEIYQSFIDRDINTIINIDKPQAFELLVRILATQIGYPLNYSNLARKAGLSVPTVQKYIWYLEKTYIIKRARPYFSNPLKEITKSPVIYFNDLGLRSYLRRTFEFDPISPELGFVFQNFVFLTLLQKTEKDFAEVKYWRTKDNAEVDFIWDHSSIPIPIEVKYGEQMRTTKMSRSMRSFLNDYHSPYAYLINRNANTIRHQHESTQFTLLPYWKLLDDSWRPDNISS